VTVALHLDTHVVVWLYAGEHDRLPPGLRARMATEILRISPMVELELTYLHEIGRLTEPSARILGELDRSIGVRLDDTPFADVVATAGRMAWTRDPFDRMIAAQAVATASTLATRDETMREHLPDTAVWD